MRFTLFAVVLAGMLLVASAFSAAASAAVATALLPGAFVGAMSTFTRSTLGPLALAATLFASSSSAHSWPWCIWVNGVDQGRGQGKYIRAPPDTEPVKDLRSPDLVCNVNGAKAVPSFVPVPSGATIGFEWYRVHRGDDIIDRSHAGPIATWIATYPDNGTITGPRWSKLAQKGYTQIIAHHESNVPFFKDQTLGTQFYPSCVQIDVVNGTGTAVPDQKFDFNAGYTYKDPGISFNIYRGSNDSYPIPGPPVWTVIAGGGSDGNGTAAGNSTARGSTGAAGDGKGRGRRGPLPGSGCIATGLGSRVVSGWDSE
ncbi:hypothetical protein C8A00DRAFT_34102 [Chaetomidium leptoderma]|uniref:lytic cellulose monooxygenase (C4-dehydrogenating) n=1 Tax=Chaetomidium leptoderma TaxID=669021 RepID=A0AAN6ZW75_9PEZI|nr:hypothetical protein C8A00DRAFT_34102 [Chaetomidium leptoderma]